MLEMPGGGELTLVAFGNQNKPLSGNPDMTYFYKVFKRYTHFSQESITIPMDGPNEMMLDTPIRIRAKIPRHADLLTDLTFVFSIPDLYSLSDENGRIPAVRWIHMLGPLIIDNLGIYVGGSKIQEFSGEWIAIRAQTDMPADKYRKWRTMVGDVPELHTPEWGIYGKSPNYPFAQGEYPSVFVPATNPAPSIPTREIRVPLPFWFSDAIGKALPLVALQLHEVEVQITLKTLREVYRVMDNATEYPSGTVPLGVQREPMRYGRNLQIIPYDPSLNPMYPTSVDPLISNAYDNLTLQNNYIYSQPNNTDALNVFYSPTNLVPQEGFIMNAHLEGNYIYLTDKEQLMFAERELTSLVYQVQTFNMAGITNRGKLDIDVYGLIHRMIFFARRSDAIDVRNDYLNLSNWKYANQAPYIPIYGGPVPNSGIAVPFGQRDILQSARLVCAGNELFEEKPANYYELHAPFLTTSGGVGLNPGVKPDDVFGPLYHIPFGLNGSDHEQPSGTLNTSRLREFQLEVNPWPIDPKAPFVYDFTIYIESINLVKFTNGMGGLAFAV
jgi:hypothetical protein